MSKVTNKELIDYCNLGCYSVIFCCDYDCKYRAECEVYEKKYGDVPYLDDELYPQNYTDEVIIVEE